MSNEGAPTTRKLNGKRKRREKTGIQREEIGVVEGAEEKVRGKKSNFNRRTNFRSKGRGGKRPR